jgi:hypothetical protein
MSEKKQRLGDLLVEVGKPRDDIWQSYRKEVEKIMEKEIRWFKWSKIAVFSVTPLLILSAIIYMGRMEETANLQKEIYWGFLAILAFLMAMNALIPFYSNRYTLEIRKDIKELTLAIKELKETVEKK